MAETHALELHPHSCRKAFEPDLYSKPICGIISGDPLLQIGTTFRLFIARQREPIVNRKKVALEKGTSQRVCNRPFRMLNQKVIEQLQRFIVGEPLSRYLVCRHR